MRLWKFLPRGKMHRVDGILFDYSIFTNISPDHIGPDEHKDFEEYLYYKTRLLDSCRIGLLNGQTLMQRP